MRVSYDKIIEDSINLPDIVGMNTPDGVKMIHCEKIEDSDYHVARYQSMVSDKCQLTVDVYKDVDEDRWVSFKVCAKMKYGEAAGEIIYSEIDDPECILDILGKAFAKAEKNIAEYKAESINVILDSEDLKKIKEKLTEILDIL